LDVVLFSATSAFGAGSSFWDVVSLGAGAAFSAGGPALVSIEATTAPISTSSPSSIIITKCQ
jgi:hypothetical protein